RLPYFGGVSFWLVPELPQCLLAREEVELPGVLDAKLAEPLFRLLLVDRQHRIGPRQRRRVGIGIGEELVAELLTGKQVSPAAVDGSPLDFTRLPLSSLGSRQRFLHRYRAITLEPQRGRAGRKHDLRGVELTF